MDRKSKVAKIVQVSIVFILLFTLNTKKQVSTVHAITPVYGWTWPTGMGLNNLVYVLKIDGNGTLYAGGKFTDAGGDLDGDRIASWDGTVWSWPNGMGLGGSVFDIEFNGIDDLYAGGQFFSAGGDPDANGIAHWDGSNWSWPTGMGLLPIYDIEIDGSGNLYVGGEFTDGGGDLDADYIAFWDGVTWSWPTGMGITPNITAFVFDIGFDGSGNVVVGGQFSDVGGDLDGDSIASWDGANWSWPTGMGLTEAVNGYGNRR